MTVSGAGADSLASLTTPLYNGYPNPAAECLLDPHDREAQREERALLSSHKSRNLNGANERNISTTSVNFNQANGQETIGGSAGSGSTSQVLGSSPRLRASTSIANSSTLRRLNSREFQELMDQNIALVNWEGCGRAGAAAAPPVNN